MSESAASICSPRIAPLNEDIFAVAMQLAVSNLDYKGLTEAFKMTKIRYEKQGRIPQSSIYVFINELYDTYTRIDSAFRAKAEFFNEVSFLLSIGMFNYKPEHKKPWSTVENHHLMRAVFLYGSDYSKIHINVFPLRDIQQIRLRWNRMFRQYFKVHFIGEDDQPMTAQQVIIQDEHGEEEEMDSVEIKEEGLDVTETSYTFDPYIYDNVKEMEEEMIYRVASQFSCLDIEPDDFIETIFYVSDEKPLQRRTFVQLVSLYNTLLNENPSKTSKQITPEHIFNVFMQRKKNDYTWVTLQEFLDQRVIPSEYISEQFKAYDIKPIRGFRIKTVEEKFTPKYFDNCAKARAAKMMKNGKKGKRIANTQEISKKKVLSHEEAIKKEEEKFISIIMEAHEHRRGIAYSEESQAFFKSLYITSPKAVDLLYNCGIAPHPQTVFEWVKDNQDALIHEIENETCILQVIHEVTDKYTTNIDGHIMANLAGDGIYLEEQGKKKLQYFAFQLQPLNKSIPCVCINIKSIGAKKESTDMHSDDIPKKLEEFARIINEDKENKFVVKFLSTDADHATDAMHSCFFEKFIKSHGAALNIKAAAQSWNFAVYIPISDFLHAMKTGRAHVLNHPMRLEATRKIINLTMLKSALNIGEALDDASHWAKMSDAFAIALFQFTSFIEVIKKTDGDEACYLAPFTFLNEAIRSPLLSIDSRINLIQCAYNMFWWNYQNITNNKNLLWKEKYHDGLAGTLLGTRIYMIRCMNLCFGIAVGILHIHECPLDRIGTHVLENFFGFIRLASKNYHTPNMMFVHTARGIIFRQCIDSLDISLNHKGRENMGGVKIKESMNQYVVFDEVDPKKITDDLVSGQIKNNEDIINVFTRYNQSIKDKNSGYPHIYYPNEFSAKQPSNRIKVASPKTKNKIPLFTQQPGMISIGSTSFCTQFPRWMQVPYNAMMKPLQEAKNARGKKKTSQSGMENFQPQNLSPQIPVPFFPTSPYSQQPTVSFFSPQASRSMHPSSQYESTPSTPYHTAHLRMHPPPESQ